MAFRATQEQFGPAAANALHLKGERQEQFATFAYEAGSPQRYSEGGMRFAGDRLKNEIGKTKSFRIAADGTDPKTGKEDAKEIGRWVKHFDEGRFSFEVDKDTQKEEAA